MSVDRYTKAVLTIIAGCLLWLCAIGTPVGVSAQRQIPFLQGDGGALPVVVVGTGTMRRDGSVTVAFRNDRTDPTLPVTLPYSASSPLPVALPYTPANPMPAHLTYTADAPLPVEVSSVRTGTSWSPLRVSVEDAPLRKKPGGGD
jgi:hypothetical protein